MKTKILRVDRCENCGNHEIYIVRDKDEGFSVNGDLTDKDIRYIVANHEKQKYEYCGNCKLTALTTTVGWDGLTQTNSEDK